MSSGDAEYVAGDIDNLDSCGGQDVGAEDAVECTAKDQRIAKGSSCAEPDFDLRCAG